MQLRWHHNLSMKKPHTMPDGKTRNAGAGPWIAREDAKSFLAFCEQHGHQTREHPGLNSRGYQVQHAGHWMPLLWNSAFKRYTADRRLSLLVQSFAASKPANYKAEPHSAAGKEL